MPATESAGVPRPGAAALLDPLDIALDRADVVSFLDYPAGRLPAARIEALLATVVAEAQPLVRAKGAYLWLAPDEAPAVGLEPVRADALVIGLVTAGPALEARVSELLAGGELTRAVLLDAAASAAAEAAANALGARIGVASGEQPLRERAERSPSLLGEPRVPRERIACRLSPGYGRWTLRWQRALFARLPHHELGVALTESCLMVPRKSISFAMWLGARERIGSGLGGCSECGLGQCRYRRRAPRPANLEPDQGASP